MFNFPKQCNEVLYEEAIKEYVSIVSKYSEVISIIQIGNVGVTGISDIDLIVYLDDTKICKNNYSLYQIDKKYHDILMHDVFIIPYKLMSKSFLITSIFDTKVVFGKNLEVENYSNSDKNYENLILLNDIAVVSLLSEYKQWYEREKKDIKLIIARLNSIKYPIMLLISIYDYYSTELSNKDNYETFVHDFTIFRKQWFSNSVDFNTTVLLDFIKKAKDDIAPKLIQDIININSISNIYKISGKNIIFNTGKEKLESDNSLFLNLLVYSQQQGAISEHIKKSIVTDIQIRDVKPEYEKLLKLRISLINQCFQFREENKIYYGELWQFGKKTKITFVKKVITKIKILIKKLRFIPELCG